MSTDERLDYLERELTAIADYVATQAAPKSKAKAEPKRRLDRVALLASLALVCVMLVLAGFKVAEYVAAYAVAFSGAAPQPTAAPLPTAEVRVPVAPVTRQEPRSAPVAAQPVSVYPDTVAPFLRGAWTPGGPFELDVSGRQYRALGQQGGATFAELDDGTRVWLGTPASPQAAPEVAPISPQAQPDLVAENAGQAAGEHAGAVDAHGHVLPYDPSDPTAVATWNQALRNSGVDVDATQVACNADVAAGGMGCQP